MATLHMTKSEREAFLEDVHIAILAANRRGGPPLQTPVWYAYTAGGDIRIVIGKDGEKGSIIRDGQAVSVCVQTEAPPYRYVTVEGIVHLEAPDFARDVVAVAERYLGVEEGRRYLAGSTAESSQAANVLLRITPTRWRTVDYGKR